MEMKKWNGKKEGDFKRSLPWLITSKADAVICRLAPREVSKVNPADTCSLATTVQTGLHHSNALERAVSSSVSISVNQGIYANEDDYKRRLIEKCLKEYQENANKVTIQSDSPQWSTRSSPVGISSSKKRVLVDAALMPNKKSRNCVSQHRRNRLIDTDRHDRTIEPTVTARVSSALISRPTENDILLGRGKGFLHHIGNKRLRALAKLLHDSYVNAESRAFKTKWSGWVVRQIKLLGGRFLRRDVVTRKMWEEIDDEEARSKVGHAIRDTPGKPHLCLSFEEWQLVKGFPVESMPRMLRTKAREIVEEGLEDEVRDWFSSV